MRAARTDRLFGLLAVGIVVLAACSDPADTLDPSATERAVGRAVAAEVEPNVTATRCAGSLTAERGGTFTCQVALKGTGTLGVKVRQTDDEGSLDVDPTAAVVAKERIASELKAALRDRFDRSFQVSCDGVAYAIRAPKSTSTCVARDRTSRRTVTVTVTVTDVTGTLAFAIGAEAD